MSTNDLVFGGVLGFIGSSLMHKNLYQNAYQLPLPKYSYDISVNLTGCKHWQYIEPNPYSIILNNGDSIKVRLSISSTAIIDIVEIRFYNICSSIQEATGKIYSYVDDQPAVPTIGIQSLQIPIYVAIPKCPYYGTNIVTIWGTDDTRGVGTFEYTYIYEGIAPLTVKTVELYIVGSQ